MAHLHPEYELNIDVQINSSRDLEVGKPDITEKDMFFSFTLKLVNLSAIYLLTFKIHRTSLMSGGNCFAPCYSCSEHKNKVKGKVPHHHKHK